jgi:uncharacterized protein (DUF1697 family)
MKTFISLLRAINVGGQNKIPLVELKRLYQALNFANVESYVQSGNLVFDSENQEPAFVTNLIEAEIERAYGAKIAVFVRDAADFRRILSTNPFLTGRSESPSFLHVTFLYSIPSQPQWAQLRAPETSSGDEFFPGVQEVFLFCPTGYGRTKLNNSFFERKLGMLATTRNWNTVQAMYQLAAER